MSEVKSMLKEAREAIKNKNFEKTIKICKNVLEQDEENYFALVFMGLSLQEIGPGELSEGAFKRAIDIDRGNLLAWNGLANYYEKLNTSEAKLELIKIYTFLIGRETVEKKLAEYCEKLCDLYKYTDVESICRVVYDKVENGNFSEATITSSRTSLANILNKSNELSTDILELYEDILANLLANQETLTSDYYSQYLTVLYRQKKFEKLLIQALKMFELFPEDTISLNWICKSYNELFVEDDTTSMFIFSDIENICTRLFNVEPHSAMALFTQSIMHFKDNKLAEAKDTLKTVVSLRPGLLHAWVLLTTTNMLLHTYIEAIDSATWADKLLQSVAKPNEVLRIKTDKMLIESLSRSTEEEDWARATEQFERLEKNEDRSACYIHKIRADIQLGRITEAKEELSSLSDDDDSCLLIAQLYRKQQKYEEALNILENRDVQTCEWFFETGVNYYELNELDKCLVPLLKAAKLEPNSFISFFYLGHYYRDNKDLNKARRCYEKCVKLCESFVDAAMELSRIYRMTKSWDANQALLETIARGNINFKNAWAWLQIGLNFMEQGEHQKAVDNLRLVLRVDSKNAHCWESLADAYLARGAYTSALKAYEKVLELSETAIYPSLQIATIKKILGKYSEAISDYEEIQKRNKDSVLTLKGLAEACIKKAKECHKQQRQGTARDYIQYAVDNIIVAIQQCSELSCLWKLLGDSCLFIACLPGKYCCLMIARAVDEGKDVEGKKILEKDDLFQLAARCYSKSLILVEDNILIWHDLATCYLLQALRDRNSTEFDELLSRAMAIAQHCTAINPGHWQHWNLLGNIAARKAAPNYALAQHAFIKAVIADHNSAVAWCNLGVIYSVKEHIKLANEAFAQAQRSDPNYVNSWIGQALLAEVLGHEDAMDLFRHSTQLGVHQQGALGYGHWVCRTLMVSPLDANVYAIHKMHAIPIACDHLTWYTETNPYNCCAWNMLGILKERMGLMLGAQEAYHNALKLSSSRYKDLARINYGRILTKLRKYKEAIKICSDVEESSFNSGIWYSLALYKDGQYQEASSIYMAIAKFLAKDKFSIGDVIACMSIITYVQGDPEAAKQSIIDSFTQRLPTARVMYALIALGVLQKDAPLVSLTLKQVEVLEDVTNSLESFITLLSYVHILQGDHLKAIRKVSELIHLLPDKSCLWLTLALTLLHSISHVKSSHISSGMAAVKAAQLALKLKEPKTNHTETAKILCTIAAASLIVNDHKTALICAQKALHCSPGSEECWIVLAAALEVDPKKKNLQSSFIKVLDSNSHMEGEVQLTKIF